MTMHLTDQFRPLAAKLRQTFDMIQSDAHHPGRFQWDWWHLPGRYTHLRTPAELFLGNQYASLVETITTYARATFGCNSISPIWLSNYVEGCEQRLHADRPHGPWAFVFSLTPDGHKFLGGETILLREEILDYWKNPTKEGYAFEEDAVLHKVPPKFGRLLVFDPRIPHGVNRVSGTLNPAEGRLVLHGWFTAPQPFIEGTLSPKRIEGVLLDLDKAMEHMGAVTCSGTVAYRITIKADGKVTNVKRLKSSLKNSKTLDQFISRYFKNARFPRSSGKSELTLPFTIS
jgi:hypothetical protein